MQGSTRTGAVRSIVRVVTMIPAGVRPSLKEGATLVETLVVEEGGGRLRQRIRTYVPPLGARGFLHGVEETEEDAGGAAERRGAPAAEVDRVLVRQVVL